MALQADEDFFWTLQWFLEKKESCTYKGRQGWLCILQCLCKEQTAHGHCQVVCFIYSKLTACPSPGDPLFPTQRAKIFLNKIKRRPTRTLSLSLRAGNTLKLKYTHVLHQPDISSPTFILLTLEIESESRLNNFRTQVTMVTQDGVYDFFTSFVDIEKSAYFSSF